MKSHIKKATFFLLFVGVFMILGSASFDAPIFARETPNPTVDDNQENRLPPRGLSTDEILRAQGIKKEADRLGLTSGVPEKILYCDLALLPIEILFSDYSINVSGQIIQDGGWTTQERDWLSSFFCKNLPLINQVYGPPYKKYTLTYVRDFYYANSSIFIPSTLEIHASATLPPAWFPQVVTHELLHAWRWQWILSANHTIPTLYDPKLDGFEEGFAQAASFAVMNEYIKKYTLNDPHVLSVQLYYAPITEWDFDFRNNGSMTTESFWSESAQTAKLFERYENAAHAISKFQILKPGFFNEFNTRYFGRVNHYIATGDPNHVFTREEIRNIIFSIVPEIEARDTKQWIDDLHIFDQAYTYGKKVWFYKLGYGQLQSQQYYLQFVETFPTGSEWSTYITQAMNFLYHRLNGIKGNLDLIQNWDGQNIVSHQVEMKDLLSWGPGTACGLNPVCIAGIGQDELYFYQPPVPMGSYQVKTPIEIQHPATPGLYKIRVGYNNPHYTGGLSRAPWGIWYDVFQTSAEESQYALLGLTGPQYNNNKILGGIIGGPDGTITIQHKSVSGISETCNVFRELFRCQGMPEWYTTILTGAKVSKSGVFTFTYTPTGSPNSYYTERVIDIGKSPGTHHFLFELSKMNVL